MPACIKDDTLDSLYSEELDSFPSKTEIPKKPGWFKMTAAGALVFSNILLSPLIGDYTGPKEAKAAGNGYISVSWCYDVPIQPSQYAKIFAIKQSNGSVKTFNVPGSRLRYNITGLDEGEVYEVKAQGCIKDQNGNEMCLDSKNKPLATARLYGNADSSSVPATANRVDSYDSSKCYSVYTGRITDPDSRQVCDFSGNYNPDMNDYNYYLRPNMGKVQANPLGTAYADCSGGRCPEIGTCSQPY